MIKLVDLLNELNIQPKNQIGYGDQQVVYPYLKDPNYVIKKFFNKPADGVLTREEIKHYSNVLNQYPKYIANIVIPSKDSKYYFQEKVDVKTSQNDIWDVVIKVIKKVASNLKEKYNTPEEANDDLNLDIEVFQNSGGWENIENINNIDDLFDITYGDGIPMDYLFNPYIYKNYTKDTPLVQKLKPVWNIGKTMTQFGSFHEDNLGYDKDKNFKIIDL